jgi:hypothetical protein
MAAKVEGRETIPVAGAAEAKAVKEGKRVHRAPGAVSMR